MIMIYSNWLLLQEIFESDVHIISYPLWCNTRAEKKEEKQQQNTQKERQNTQIRLFALMFFSSLLAHQSPPKMIVSVSLSFHLFVVFFFHPCPFFFLDCVYVCVCVCKKKREKSVIVREIWSRGEDSSKTKCLHQRCQTLPTRQEKLGQRPIPKWTISFFLYFSHRVFFFSPLLTRSFLLTPSSSSPTQP